MKDIVIILVLALILGSAISYIVKAKKKGVKCIGCPHSKECSAKESCSDKQSDWS